MRNSFHASFIAALCDAFVVLMKFDLVKMTKLAKNANTTFIVAHSIAKAATAVGVLADESQLLNAMCLKRQQYKMAIM